MLEEREAIRQEDAIPPEEQELFREFQSYVRSIYTAATSGAVQTLEARTAVMEARLNEVTNELADTVQKSRDAYADLFAPAIDRLETAVKAALREHVSRKERELAELSSRMTNAVKIIAGLVALNLVLSAILILATR